MKSFLLLVSFVLLSPLHADFVMQPNDVLGIGGDSITEQHYYSAYIEDYLLMCQPTAGQKILQFGWGGEGAPSFLQRLDTDVYPFKPTVMTTNYGMNDGQYRAIDPEIADHYKQAQTEIVESFKKNGVRTIIIGSPKCVDSYYYHRDQPPGQADIYNKTLGDLAEFDKEIARKEGVIYADVYGITLDVMKKSKAKFGEDYMFAGGDGVHPNEDGHLVMAYAYLKALGCDGNIGTITVSPLLNHAEATPGHEVVSYDNGTVTLKSSRYPFCFNGTLDSKEPNVTAAVTQFFPFNEDLNRFTLVVKGLTAPKVKVTWGETTKEYTSDQLSKGINLATEFLQNPFVDQFNKVNTAVHAQQDQEALLTKTFMHNVAQWKTIYATGADSLFDQLIDAGKKQHSALFQQAVDLVVPITHTIKIEPEP